MNSKPKTVQSLVIVGRGRVGNAFAEATRQIGIETALIAHTELDTLTGPDADLVLLAVPDRAITAVCERLIVQGRRPGLVAHFSGATGLGALEAAAAAGLATGGLHPLQTFSRPGTELKGVPCAITAGAPQPKERLEAFALHLGMRPFRLEEDDRAAYHAAAAIASNFLITLEETAAGLLRDLGLGQTRELLGPLVQTTAANWAERGPEALTGPIVRGDQVTIEAHMAAIGKVDPGLLPLYRDLARRTRLLKPATATEGTAR